MILYNLYCPKFEMRRVIIMHNRQERHTETETETETERGYWPIKGFQWRKQGMDLQTYIYIYTDRKRHRERQTHREKKQMREHGT